MGQMPDKTSVPIEQIKNKISSGGIGSVSWAPVPAARFGVFAIQQKSGHHACLKSCGLLIVHRI
jgi:hypothetical protein